MAKKKAKPPAADEETFEQSLGALEAVVADLEGGELGLADALARYEEGVQRLKRCHTQLEAAERRIELLSGVDADGNPVTEPFDDTPSSAESGPSRSKKRSAAPKKPPSTEGTEGVDDDARLF